MATSVEAVELASHGSKRARALFIPYPLHGQINPMMHLAKTLTNRDPNLHITFINNYHYHIHLMAKLHGHGSSSTTHEASGMRNRAQEFKTAIKRATECGGTSYTNIEKFIHSFRK